MGGLEHLAQRALPTSSLAWARPALQTPAAAACRDGQEQPPVEVGGQWRHQVLPLSSISSLLPTALALWASHREEGWHPYPAGALEEPACLVTLSLGCSLV